MSLADRIVSHNLNFTSAAAAAIRAEEAAKKLYAEETARVIENIKDILGCLNTIKGFKEIKAVHNNRTIYFRHSPVASHGVCAYDSDERWLSKDVVDYVNDGVLRDFFAQPNPSGIVERVLSIQPWFLASH